MSRLLLPLILCGLSWSCAVSGPPTVVPTPLSEADIPENEREIREIVKRITFHYEWVGDIDRLDFNEPSGIVYHEQRGTLFVVGDEGDLCEIQPDGTPVKNATIRRGADFEGVTSVPETGLIYIGVEGDETILEVDPDTFEVTREFTINRTFNGETVLHRRGNGLEGLCFVPRTDHPEGGTFFVANQNFSRDEPDDRSAIFEVEVPLTSGGSEATIIREIDLGVTDLAGLHWDPRNRWLYAVSDANNFLFRLNLKGQILALYAFTGANQEGIAMDADGNVYIAQDSGGIVLVRWLRP